jgi:hypothetical protein
MIHLFILLSCILMGFWVGLAVLPLIVGVIEKVSYNPEKRKLYTLVLGTRKYEKKCKRCNRTFIPKTSNPHEVFCCVCKGPK